MQRKLYVVSSNLQLLIDDNIASYLRMGSVVAYNEEEAIRIATESAKKANPGCFNLIVNVSEVPFTQIQLAYMSAMAHYGSSY